jgi:hypothetical protein
MRWAEVHGLSYSLESTFSDYDDPCSHLRCKGDVESTISESRALGFILERVKQCALTRVAHMAEVLRLGFTRLSGVEHGDDQFSLKYDSVHTHRCPTDNLQYSVRSWPH